MSQQEFHARRDIKFKEIREELAEKKIIHIGANPKRYTEEPNADQTLLQGLQMPERPDWKLAKSKS